MTKTKKITNMTDDELKEINKKIDDWKEANSNWESMQGTKAQLSLFKSKCVKAKNRKAAFTALKMHFKNNYEVGKLADMTDEEKIEDGYLDENGNTWNNPFSTRRNTTEVDPIIDEIMANRIAFAEMLDNNGEIDDVVVSNYIKTLKFEIRNKSSINADNPVHNFTSWVDKMTYDNEIMKTNLKYAWKNRKVKLDAMTKVESGKNKGNLSRKPHSDYKWDGSLENGLEINFTPKNRSRSTKN